MGSCSTAHKRDVPLELPSGLFKISLGKCMHTCKINGMKIHLRVWERRGMGRGQRQTKNPSAYCTISCSVQSSSVLLLNIAPVPPHPNILDTCLTVTKSSEVKNCCYPSSPAEELRMERIRTKARRSPEVARAELRHYVLFKYVQNSSRVMYLRVCMKPHF